MSKYHYRYPHRVWGCEMEHPVLGALALAASEQGLVRLDFYSMTGLRSETSFCPDKIPADVDSLLVDATRQIGEYLGGKRRCFDLAIDWSVFTPFMEVVLKVVYAIPFGEVKTYGEVAGLVKKPGASRAVGSANAHNPLPLLIPCHRVIGSDRGLHGFAAPGGLETKKWLLELEGHRFVDQKLV